MSFVFLCLNLYLAENQRTYVRKNKVAIGILS